MKFLGGFLDVQFHKFNVGDVIVLTNEKEANRLWHGHKFVARIYRLFTSSGNELCYEVSYLTPVLELGRKINSTGCLSVRYADKNMMLY